MAYENNLLNLKPSDPVYRYAAEELSEALLARIPEEFKRLPQLPIMVADTYFVHYSYVPLLREDRNPDSVLETVRQLTKQYMESEEYRRVRSLTTLDSNMSKVYSVKFVQYLFEELKKELEKTEEGRQLLQQLADLPVPPIGGGAGKNDLNGIEDPLGGSLPGQGGGKEQGGYEGGSGSQGGKADQEKLQDIMDKLSKKLQEMGGRVVKEAARKARKAAEKAKEIQKILGNVNEKGRGGGKGGHGAGDQPGTFQELLDLAEHVLAVRWAEQVVTLANKLADTMPRMLKRVKTPAPWGEIAGYRKARSLEEAIPTELALPEELFYAKIAEGALLAFEKLVEGEGAYYVLLDKSGSMCDFDKTVWSRSVALAFLILARRKKREYFLRFFDHHVWHLIDSPLEALKKLLRIENNGGTSIDSALRTAIEDIARRGLGNKTNTVIIITDGEDQIAVEPSELKKYNITLQAVMIQGYNEKLEELARETGGKLYQAELSEDGALEILEASA